MQLKTFVSLLLVTFSLGKNFAQPDVKSVRDRLLTGLSTFKEQSWDSTTKINQPYTISFSEIADTTFQKTWTTSLQMENGDSILFRFDKVKDKIKNGIFFNSNAILPDTFKKSDNSFHALSDSCKPNLMYFNILNSTTGNYTEKLLEYNLPLLPFHKKVEDILKNEN